MASLNLTQEELKSLEQTRQRLFLLSNSLASLKNDIVKGQPLPPPSSLQATANILKENLNSLQAVAAEHGDLFQRLAVHPSTNFPGRTQENTLLQLLRKKLEPEVENWATLGREEVAKAREAAVAAGAAGGGGVAAAVQIPEELEKVWAETRAWCLDRTRRYVESEATELFTAEERALGVENVRTGLKRYAEEEDEEDDEDDDGEDGDNGEDEDMEGTDGAANVGSKKNKQRAREGEDDEEDDEEELPESEALVELDRTFWFGSVGETTLPPLIQTRP